VSRCLHSDYMQTFHAVRDLLTVGDDGASLAGLRQDVEYMLADSRSACLLAFDDALRGRPLRSRRHFCRMHVGADCSSCEAPAA
jgi:hypothetical protein